MDKNLSPVLKILGIAVAIVIVSSLLLGGSIDIHIYDTYFIIGSITKLVLLMLLALFGISLVVSTWTKFKNKLYVKILLFSTFLLITFGMYIFSLLTKIK